MSNCHCKELVHEATGFDALEALEDPTLWTPEQLAAIEGEIAHYARNNYCGGHV